MLARMKSPHPGWRAPSRTRPAGWWTVRRMLEQQLEKTPRRRAQRAQVQGVSLLRRACSRRSRKPTPPRWRSRSPMTPSRSTAARATCGSSTSSASRATPASPPSTKAPRNYRWCGAAVGITSGTFGNYLAQLGERSFRPELAKLASLAREAREKLSYCVTFLKNLNDRTYSELVARKLVDMACDTLGAHLMLVQAETRSGPRRRRRKVCAGRPAAHPHADRLHHQRR